MMRALVVGDILLDTIAEVDPATVDLNCRVNTRECEICFGYGTKIPVQEEQTYPGGNAANAAAGLTTLGLTTMLAATVGDDDAGRHLIQTLVQRGVNTEQIQIDPAAPTSSSFIVRYLGERTIFSYHAPHGITIQPIEADLVYLTSARTDLADLIKGITAAASDVPLIFQPGTGQIKLGVQQLAPVLAKTTTLILNEDEAAVLLNNQNHRLSPKQLLHALLDTKANEVVVTAGQKGAYLSDGRDFIHCEIWDAAIRRDTTGVGDAFAAGYVWSRYAAKSDLRQAAAAGTLNAGSVISHPGAQEGLLDVESIQKKLQSTAIKIHSI